MAKVISILGVISVGLVASWYLLSLYRHRQDSDNGQIIKRRGWADRWAFTPDSLGGFSYRSLILISLLGLFLELLMIRWISCEVRIFAYFKNFVLIGCFLGFGLGCYLCRVPINLLSTVVPPVLIVLLITLPIPSLRYVIDVSLSQYLGGASGLDFWYVYSVPTGLEKMAKLVAVIGVTVPLFILVSLTFVPIGQLLGWYLERAPNGIAGYTVNILASLAGILLYTLLCFLEQGPVVWFAMAGMMLAGMLWKVKVLRWTSVSCYALCLVLLTCVAVPGKKVYWSPYQKLAISPTYGESGQLVRYQLTTNNVWYQFVINLSEDFVAGLERLFEGVPIEFHHYNLPYRFHSSPQSVLVLGSGMGNDVAAALRNGADQVVAVEIDPTIVKLGKELHFEKPYESSNVEIVVDDARSYIEKTSARFDLIVFALLDSHTTSSHYTNIRTDNYVYTFEALESTKRLLKPDGVLVLSFQANKPWIAGRLQGLLTQVFDYPPLQLQEMNSGGRLFVTGSKRQIANAVSDESLAGYVSKRGHFEIEQCTLTTDDWPYFYQKDPGLPPSVIIISLVLIALCALALRSTGTTIRSMRWHFFFLGAGFLLLEVHIVSKMALLFGTTWLVNSIVIGGLLLMIVGANMVVMVLSRVPMWVAYAGLFVSMLVAYLLPPSQLFVDSLWLRILLASAALCLPVFFAGIIFIQSFARAGFRGEALGSNLIGSLVGGLVEALSFWSGIKALLLIGALLYLSSLLTLGREPCTSSEPKGWFRSILESK